jgi:hypothetical protein
MHKKNGRLPERRSNQLECCRTVPRPTTATILKNARPQASEYMLSFSAPGCVLMVVKNACESASHRYSAASTCCGFALFCFVLTFLMSPSCCMFQDTSIRDARIGSVGQSQGQNRRCGQEGIQYFTRGIVATYATLYEPRIHNCRERYLPCVLPRTCTVRALCILCRNCRRPQHVLLILHIRAVFMNHPETFEKFVVPEDVEKCDLTKRSSQCCAVYSPGQTNVLYSR